MVMSLPLSAAMAAPLHDAIEARDLEKVKELIAKGADVNAKNCDDAAPLHFAIGWGFENDVVELLIAKGADVNAKTKDGITPLRMTAFLGLQATAEFLIAKGADVNAKDKYGITSLQEARRRQTLIMATSGDCRASDRQGRRRQREGH